MGHGFKKCYVEYGVYIKCKKGELKLLICSYVVDLQITRLLKWDRRAYNCHEIRIW
jgi:hypothetical protein